MNNFITNLLLIKDQNITMEDKLDLINVDGQDTFIFHGTLSHEPKCCTNCGCIKEVLDYILAIDDEFTASYERVHEIREVYRYGY